MSAERALLRVDDLRVAYHTRRGHVQAVDGVTFEVRPGEVTALVGESGSGKTTVAQAVIGLLAGNGRVTGGGIRLGDTELTGLSDRRMRDIRGRRIGLIPQDPGNSLNPVVTIGASIAESLRIHGWRDRAKIRARVLDLLERVDIDDPETRIRQYPHELSGGMRQRVLIAAALALEPELVIADEPTSALDVTVQKRVLDLLDRLRTELGAGVLFITHDLAVASDHSQSLVVMRGGQVQEQGRTAEVLSAPASEYTRTLLADAPSLGRIVERVAPRAAVEGERPLVEVEGLRQEFWRLRGCARSSRGGGGTRRSSRSTTSRSRSRRARPTRSSASRGRARPRPGAASPASAAPPRVGSSSTASTSPRCGRRATSDAPRSSCTRTPTGRSIRARASRRSSRSRCATSASATRRSATSAPRTSSRLAARPEIGARKPWRLSGGQRQHPRRAHPRAMTRSSKQAVAPAIERTRILRLLAAHEAELGLAYVFISATSPWCGRSPERLGARRGAGGRARTAARVRQPGHDHPPAARGDPRRRVPRRPPDGRTRPMTGPRVGFFTRLLEQASAADRYRFALEQIEQAERVGFASAWIAQHHFHEQEGGLPSPLVLLAAAAQRTARIALATGIVTLPLDDPIRVAEDAAVLDALSGGRVQLGVGTGGTPSSFEAFGHTFDERRAVFADHLEVLVDAFSGRGIRGTAESLYPVANGLERRLLAGDVLGRGGGARGCARRRAAAVAHAAAPGRPAGRDPVGRAATRIREGLPGCPGDQAPPRILVYATVVVVDPEDRAAILERTDAGLRDLAARFLKLDAASRPRRVAPPHRHPRGHGRRGGRLLGADETLHHATDVAFQVHSVDAPHEITLRSLELLATEVAPRLGLRVGPETAAELHATATADAAAHLHPEGRP